MNAAGYVLASSLLSGDKLPLPHRAAWAGLLRTLEPHPSDVELARHTLNLCGLLVDGKLSPSGLQAALSTLHGLLTPLSTANPSTKL